MEQNDAFGLPPLNEAPAKAVKPAEESAADKVARLRAKAEAQAAAEFNEDAVYAKLLAEARDTRTKILTGEQVELPTDTRGLPEDYDVIRISRGQNKDDPLYVPLSLNGLCIRVPRGRDVIIPHVFVVDCLDQCVETLTTPKIDAMGRLSGFEVRDVERYPYNFKRKATKAEYEAFQAQERETLQRETARAA